MNSVAVSVSLYDYMFPVIGAEVVRNDAETKDVTVVRQVYGTAFCLFGKCFITNEHVIRAASEWAWWGLAAQRGGEWVAFKAEEEERFADYDIGILKASVPDAKSLAWSTRELPMLTDVQVSGYPYALDLDNMAITPRAFKGSIVTQRTWRELAAHPRVYELSFPCPRGISGSPLWLGGSPPKVAGVVFGNSVTDMIVHRDTEINDAGTETSIYERVESMHLGLAVQTGAIKSIQSAILGMTVGEFLHQKGLLVDGDDKV